ncbi:MAG TPA: hypothetical protein VED37_07590 [Ktedonobacteraceae bacterium]|nr:hypothetical protein [Ktedonobacteraceae bacterium]
METRTLPGPFAIYLNLECPAEERADEHEKSKHANAHEGWINDDATDDIGSDQNFQPDHDRSPQVQAQMAIRRRGITESDEEVHESYEGDDGTNDENGNTRQFECRDDQLNRVLDIHSLPSRCPEYVSISNEKADKTRRAGAFHARLLER